MASAAAVRMALEVLVAPDTVSIARDWCSTIAAGMLAIAGSDRPGVSACSVTSTAVIASSDTVTLTFTGPLLPFASAV